mmetsp:Transcript_9631/g.26072  ORF Transcript_9631/g.26072 Transcript_9631/m.26072 type:complete len:235 (-) Transcript_9631:1739-2443(-)
MLPSGPRPPSARSTCRTWKPCVVHRSSSSTKVGARAVLQRTLGTSGFVEKWAARCLRPFDNVRLAAAIVARDEHPWQQLLCRRRCRRPRCAGLVELHFRRKDASKLLKLVMQLPVTRKIFLPDLPDAQVKRLFGNPLAASNKLACCSGDHHLHSVQRQRGCATSLATFAHGVLHQHVQPLCEFHVLVALLMDLLDVHLADTDVLLQLAHHRGHAFKLGPDGVHRGHLLHRGPWP